MNKASIFRIRKWFLLLLVVVVSTCRVESQPDGDLQRMYREVFETLKPDQLADAVIALSDSGDPLKQSDAALLATDYFFIIPEKRRDALFRHLLQGSSKTITLSFIYYNLGGGATSLRPLIAPLKESKDADTRQLATAIIEMLDSPRQLPQAKPSK